MPGNVGRVWALSLVLLLSGVAVGCAKQPSATSTDSVVAPSVACSQIDPAQRAAAAKANKRNLAANPHGIPVANAGDWAYVSAPQNITASGSYTFRFGPLAADFNYPVSPSGLAYDFPTDFPGTIRPAADSDRQFVTAGSQRFLDLTFQIVPSSACRGLVLVIY